MTREFSTESHLSCKTRDEKFALFSRLTIHFTRHLAPLLVNPSYRPTLFLNFRADFRSKAKLFVCYSRPLAPGPSTPSKTEQLPIYAPIRLRFELSLRVFDALTLHNISHALTFRQRITVRRILA